MRFFDYLRSVRHTLSANRLRAALTLLGTVIGSASIVLLAGVLRSGEDMLINSAQQATESDLITVRPNEVGLKASRIKYLNNLSRFDEPVITGNELLPGVQVASESQRELTAEPITDGPKMPDVQKDFRVRFVSASDDTVDFYKLKVERGRGLSREDLLLMSRVCVVGSDVWTKLFGDKTPLSDQRLRIDGHQWQVVGVLKSKPLMGGGGGGNETWMWNRKVLVPQTTFDTMFQPDHSVNRLYVRLSKAKDLAKKLKLAEWVVSEILLRRHGIPNFKIDAQNSSEGQENLILNVIKGLLLSTALLSLFVGGINIMNIMLVTVTERTREIGVRRAIGAPPRSIWIQFLLEAAFIAGVGGVVGVLSGIGLTWLIAHALSSDGSFAFRIETWSVVLGLVLSVTTGIVFGLFPAVRASKLDPVEALRFE
jgi:putative ABC transport system permease protein